jgi:class 3 adenylate cyclase
MAWNEERSRERVEQNDFADFDVNVQDLSRTMDFGNLGTKDVRRVVGCHIYADIPNFHDAVVEAGDDQQKQRKLIRAASVLRRIQGNLLEGDEIGGIQRQSVRLHGLNFRPYDDQAARAKRAVIFGITVNSYVYDAFNDVFSDVTDFHSAVGVASGTSYVANIGRRGNRELISLGSCANRAAKVLADGDTVRVTKDVYDDLPDCLKEHFKKSGIVAGVQTYQATGVRWGKYPELAEELGVNFDEDAWRDRTEKAREALPLSEIEISDATVLIDVEKLTERNCKRTSGLPLYADLSGFTRYVQQAENDDEVVSLVRQFHMIRTEFHSVVESDYDGLVLQHQGDCIFGIVHMPCGADRLGERCQQATDVAVALQSSMEHVLNEHLQDKHDIHVAVGVDVGKTLVTRLGKQGKRVVICLGPKVTGAERLQLQSGGQQIRISETVYDSLEDEDMKAEFKEDGDSYLAKKLTFPVLDEAKEEKAAEDGSLGATVEEGSIRVTTAATTASRPWRTSKPWLSR